MTKKILLLFMFVSVLTCAQENDTLARVPSQIFSDTLTLRDTIYVNRTETTFVSLPYSLIPVKHDTLIFYDTLYLNDTTAAAYKTTDEFKSIKFLKVVNLFTLFEIILLLFGGTLLSKLIDKARFFVNDRYRMRTLPVVLAGAKIFLWIIILYIVLSLFITRTDELIAALFFIGLILLGVSALPFMRNLAGGFYISLSKPFEKGDYISVNNHRGEITQIGWRSTIILTEERSFVNIPNSVFLSESIENVNVGQKEQLVSLSFEFPIDYDDKVIIKILRESAISSPYLFSKKEPSVLLDNTDYIKRINRFKLNLYLFDSRFENDMIHSINLSILAAVKSKIEMKKGNNNE